MRFLALPLLMASVLTGGPTRFPAPDALWAQISIVAPGTNSTVRTETVAPTQPGSTAVLPLALGVAVPVSGSLSSGVSAPTPVGSAASPGDVVAPVRPAAIGINQAPSPGSSPSSNVTNGGDVSTNGALLSDDPCAVHILSSTNFVPYTGGTVEIRFGQKTAAGCAAPSIGASGSWLQMAQAVPGVVRFSAAPNVSAAAREAVIVLGSRSLKVEQSGLPVIQAASAPGRLTIGVARDGTIERRRLRVWGEGATITLSSTAPWLKLEGIRVEKGTTFAEVAVDASALPAGARIEAAVLATSSEPGKAPMRIPVVIERGQFR